MSHWYYKNLQCRIESNQLSRTAVRGLFGARFVWLFFLSTCSSAGVGAPTSNSEPDTSVRGNSGSSPWTTGSPERLYTKTQQPHEVIFILGNARSKTSPNGIHWLASTEILNSKANGNRWRFENSHCGRWAVSMTPSDTLFSSLLRRRISESVNPSDSYPGSPTSSTPPTTSTSSSSSSASASVPASVSHTPLTSIGPSRPPTGLSLPLSPATFSSGTTTGGRGNNNLNSWLIVHLGRIDLRKEDDTVFGHTLRIASKNVANKLIHGGFIISFMKFIIILIFIMTDLSASNDVIINIIIIFSKIHWGSKLNFSSFSKLVPWFVYKLSFSVIPPNTRLEQLEWYRGNFKVSPAWRRMPTDFLFQSSLFKVASLISAAQTLSLIFSFLQTLSKSLSWIYLWIPAPQSLTFFT